MDCPWLTIGDLYCKSRHQQCAHTRHSGLLLFVCPLTRWHGVYIWSSRWTADVFVSGNSSAEHKVRSSIVWFDDASGQRSPRHHNQLKLCRFYSCPTGWWISQCVHYFVFFFSNFLVVCGCHCYHWLFKSLATKSGSRLHNKYFIKVDDNRLLHPFSSQFRSAWVSMLTEKSKAHSR